MWTKKSANAELVEQFIDALESYSTQLMDTVIEEYNVKINNIKFIFFYIQIYKIFSKYIGDYHSIIEYYF
jgi:hypothetical protein